LKFLSRKRRGRRNRITWGIDELVFMSFQKDWRGEKKSSRWGIDELFFMSFQKVS
jgi:hypothetical protein